MRSGIALVVIALLVANASAQDAAQPAVTLSPTPSAQPPPPEPLSPEPPSPEKPSPTPILPELSALDQAFNQTGLGKDADEMRTRIEMRKLQNQVERQPAVVAAKASADAATTDLEKRERLRDYYEVTYGLMSQNASSSGLKAAIANAKKEKLAQLAQPRVRPGSGETPAPTPKKKKKKKSGKHF